MAGLYIKELIIRGDAERILVVAPGSLVTQWQDELFDKFGLRFEIVTKDMIDSVHVGDVFQERNRLICRVDKIARREDLVERLSKTDWDLVVVNEAHRMSWVDRFLIEPERYARLWTGGQRRTVQTKTPNGVSKSRVTTPPPVSGPDSLQRHSQHYEQARWAFGLSFCASESVWVILTSLVKISTVLDHIDSGHMALPEFQRGYVWNGRQVRSLFDSLYRRHPIGGLLVWVTESRSADHRGDDQLAAGVVKLILDGQQRMTTLYGVVRGRPPSFFEGNTSTISNLRFHLDSEEFGFYQPMKMKDDPLWIDVTELMQKGLAWAIGRLDASAAKFGEYVSRLSRLAEIVTVDLHVEEVTGEDKSLDVVVDIFNRVNSGGTKLSKGDLALAKVCADWPDARETMKKMLREWESSGYRFTLDWVLRSVNTVLTGEAKFSFLHHKSSSEVQDALWRAKKAIDTSLNMIAGRLGLDHNRVLFGRFAVPVMVRYLDQHKGPLSAEERDKLLFWFVQAGMWGRFSGSTETRIDQDLAALDTTEPLDGLLEQLRLWHGGLRTEAGHFAAWSVGARFYPVLYLLTRMGQAQDWGTGLPLKSQLLGPMNRLEVHHIFPKSQLYKRQFRRPEVNTLANFCFLTKDTNLGISDRLPEDYFREVAVSHPGALESQWIPIDQELWKIDNYLDFLEARRILLAEETNRRLRNLLHDDDRWLEGPTMARQPPVIAVIPGGITSVDEETELKALNEWVEAQGFPLGQIEFGHTDSDTGEQLAVFDLVWPNGLQAELSQPVAVLLDEGTETLSIAAAAGYRCFTSGETFRDYVTTEISPLTVEV